MSSRHVLSTEGSFVELRDPSELRYGDKQKVLRSINDPKAAMDAGIDMSDALTALLVVSWSLQLPVPSQDPKVIGMLSLADGNILEKLIEPARELLFPGDPEPADAEALAEAVADQASPTTPSVDS